MFGTSMFSSVLSNQFLGASFGVILSRIKKMKKDPVLEYKYQNCKHESIIISLRLMYTFVSISSTRVHIGKCKIIEIVLELKYLVNTEYFSST